MPEPVGRSQRYMPGLDGVRALAVAAVIGYHLGISWLPGGLLGVGVFFTLSGYLITDLLLASWESTGGLALRQFWARRARRLLPALFVMLVVVSIWAAIARPSQVASLRGQVLAAVFYVNNWWAAFQHVSYFARFGPPSPLGNLWSLSIEEQFYLVWPWLLLVGLAWLRWRGRRLDRARQRSRELTLENAGKPLPALEFAFAGAGAPEGALREAMVREAVVREAVVREAVVREADGGGAGLRLLGPYVDRSAGRRVPVLAGNGGGASRPAEGWALDLDGPHDLASGDYAGPDLLAIGNLYSGRAARGAVVPEPFSERLYRAYGVSPKRRKLAPLALVALVLAFFSALEMALLYHPSFDPSRIYDGTDTRAFALLLGAALAMLWPSSGMRRDVSGEARRALDLLGAVGLVVIFVLVCSTGQYSAWLYRGGMVLLSLGAVAVVASAAHPATRLGRVLGMRPLKWLGVRSYGVYLWHYPVIVLTESSANGRFDLPRAVLQIAATLLLAELSWRFIESPIRHGALGPAWREIKSALKNAASAVGAWAMAATAAWRHVPPAEAPARARLVLSKRDRQRLFPAAAVSLCVLVAGLALTGVLQSPPPAGSSVGAPLTVASSATTRARGPGAATSASMPATSASTTPATSVVTTPASGATTTTPVTRASTTPATSASTTPAKSVATTPASSVAPPPSAAPGAQAALRTSCTQVAHFGDSTSDSLVSPNYLPNPSQRLGAQYTRVGVQHSVMRIEGGTSIVETLPGTENAYQMAQTLVQQGYKGCWVLALGTNDAADVFVGSNVDAAKRVKDMMSLIGDQPVLWVNVKTLVSSGPYAEANMQRWNQALLQVCRSYPNMAVFNWAGMVQPSWFISDGIHYTSNGSAKRAAAIADALATAFPAGGPPGRRAGACLVNGSPNWHLPNFQY